MMAFHNLSIKVKDKQYNLFRKHLKHKTAKNNDVSIHPWDIRMAVGSVGGNALQVMRVT